MRSHSFVAAAALATASLAAHADTITQTTSFGTTDGTNHSVSFNPIAFNPADGTLNSITISASGNYTSQPFATVFAEVQSQVLDPTSSTFSPTGSGSFLVMGTSTNAADLMAAEMGYRIFAEVDSPGLLSSNINLSYAYNYTPNVTPIGATPEPSSFALLGTGLLGALGVARKRFA